MGWRAIRIFLEHRDLMKDQLAAIMTASSGRDVRIMFPMVSGVDEVIQLRAIADEVKGELAASGVSFNDSIPLGIMVEIPSAVQTARMLAKECDFFSIGTNDLIQYTIAADRNNPRVKSYYNPYHPAVLTSIHSVAVAAREAGIPVSVCGEMAADPLSALILAGLGVDELSMAAPAIPVVKQAVCGATISDARAVASELLQMSGCAEIAARLKEAGLQLGVVS
jgi:phosphotransferase system enzyme I (PtsP)